MGVKGNIRNNAKKLVFKKSDKNDAKDNPLDTRSVKQGKHLCKTLILARTIAITDDHL